jgi:predicted nucleic acid-binding protein
VELNPAELHAKQIYALDTVVLIYFLERHPDYYDGAKNLFRRIEAGEISAVLSTLVFAELLVPAFRLNKTQLIHKIIRSLSNFPNLKMVPVSPDISIDAARLRAKIGIRTPDAIHLSTAFASNAKGLITNDKALLKAANDDFRIWLFDNPNEKGKSP